VNDELPAVQPAETSPLAEETDERNERASWRSSVVGSIVATLVAGLWLVASAGPLSYSEPAGPVILGLLIAILCLLRLFGPITSRTLALTTAAAGGLTALAAFLFNDGPGETVNQALVGLAVVALTMVGLGAGAERSRTSRP
jgi:hypothetical protein